MALRLARALHDPEALWQELQAHWRRGHLVGLAPPQERSALASAVLGLDAARCARQTVAPEGETGAGWIEGCGEAALVLGSGGSSGGRRWCLQPLSHLQASARACGTWLAALGFDPGQCLHLDALPLHHVSGLMPLVRAREWGADLRWLPPDLLRHGAELPQACPLPAGQPVLLSLVPTQLHRLLATRDATAWLRGCAVIWVGGAALSPDLAERARSEGLPLAPCYGATETAAMICALSPERFLAGEAGCGPPLEDVELRLEGNDGAIAVRTGRLSPGWFEAGRLHPFVDTDGWWRSGDGGDLRSGRSDGAATTTNTHSLVIHGRLDGAVHSGGETVFPEQVRQRLLALIGTAGLPVAELLVLSEADPLWGERLVALVRWRNKGGSDAPDTPPPDPLDRLVALASGLPPAQRPRRWLACAELERNPTGKWERQRWQTWLVSTGSDDA